MKTVTEMQRGLVILSDDEIRMVEATLLVREYKAMCAKLRASIRKSISNAEIALMSVIHTLRAPLPEKAYEADSFEPEFTVPTVDHMETKQVSQYQPGKYDELSLVHTKVIERIGHKWRKRTYWRIAGEKIHGRFDYIRCDGPEYEPKETYVPANFRRSTTLQKGISRRAGKKNSVSVFHIEQQPAGSQLKRNRIASVPMAIRYQSAVKLLKRLDEQALKAFHKGNTARYDTLDARANLVHEWIKHVASKFPDLFFKKPDAVPVTDKQKLAHDLKAMPKTYRVKSATDRKAATKLRNDRIARQEKWTSRVARSNGAHYSPKSR